MCFKQTRDTLNRTELSRVMILRLTAKTWLEITPAFSTHVFVVPGDKKRLEKRRYEFKNGMNIRLKIPKKYLNTRYSRFSQYRTTH